MSKSWFIHYKNKYPGGSVRMSDASFDVYAASGEHVVALRKDGAGGWSDQSAELGLRDAHDLAPIPKDSRVHKLVDGKVGLSEEHEHREKARGAYVCPDKKDVVLSCDALKKHGFSFDEKQKEIK